jgi:hypothetical protein
MPSAARGSIGLGTSRLLTISISVTWAALAIAASVAPRRRSPSRRSDCRRLRVDLRRAGFQRCRRIGHGRQLLVVDLDRLGRVACLAERLGDDDDDRVADIADDLVRERRQAPIFIGEPSLEWIIQPQIRLPMPSALRSACRSARR